VDTHSDDYTCTGSRLIKERGQTERKPRGKDSAVSGVRQAKKLKARFRHTSVDAFFVAKIVSTASNRALLDFHHLNDRVREHSLHQRSCPVANHVGSV